MTIETERKKEESYMALRKEESEKKREHNLRIVEVLSHNCLQAQMLQIQQSVTSQIELQFLSYLKQNPILSTRRESNP